MFDHASCPPVRPLAFIFGANKTCEKAAVRCEEGLADLKRQPLCAFRPGLTFCSTVSPLTADGQKDGLRSDGSSADRGASKRRERGPVSGHPRLSEQGGFQSKTANGVNNLTCTSLILLAAVQTCRPEDLLHCLLQLIQDAQPGRISETILAALPPLQTGITGGGQSIHMPYCEGQILVQREKIIMLKN